MTPEQFVSKWKAITLKESATDRIHFNDLCDLLGVPKPLDVDPDGSFYTFQKHVDKVTGGKGFADVWYGGRFALEYKGKDANLKKAYEQLLAYREDLGNPPLLIVCDLNTIEVHTNFTATQKVIERFTLDDLLNDGRRQRLKLAWTDPDTFNPAKRRAAVTEATVRDILVNVADRLKKPEHNYAPDFLAHFLVKVVFTLFAEDAELLPKNTFTRLLEAAQERPEDFKPMAEQLFSLMSGGGLSLAGRIPHFNGEIFTAGEAPTLTIKEINTLLVAAGQDWTAVEPSIFGTLFERIIDPAKRAQAGAHYTPPADILAVIEPVVLEPLRAEWEALRGEVEPLTKTYYEGLADGKPQQNIYERPLGQAEKGQAVAKLEGFLDRLSRVRVLDPACGSGNFLYMTMQALMDLELSVRATLRLLEPGKVWATRIHPKQFYGLEFNKYAHEIAGMVLWIGYLQWLRAHDEGIRHEPILQKLENLQNVDAVLDGDKPREWPEVDYIVGNPPFLGDKRMRSELSDDYVQTLRRAYAGRVPGQADLVCYWFEVARKQLETAKAKRVGLLATNSIRGGANRKVLEHIKDTGDIFMAWSDRAWIQEGAAVRVSIIGFDDGSETSRKLDDQLTSAINPDLTSSIDLSKAKKLVANKNTAFIGLQKGGAFDIPSSLARTWLDSPNPDEVRNEEVVKPYIKGKDVTERAQNMFLIDFNQMSEVEASRYVLPFTYVEEHIKPSRQQIKREKRVKYWWLHHEPAPQLREAIRHIDRYLLTTIHAKYRIWKFYSTDVLPDKALCAVAADSYAVFGILHSKVHEVWALAMGTILEDRPRYTPTTCFETFPFPRPSETQHAEVEKWAKYLDKVRRQLLEADKTRTMTGLYNDVAKLKASRNSTHPVFGLLNAHERLDAAVAAAYGWEWPLADETILERLLALNLERAAQQGAPATPVQPVAETLAE